MLRRTSGEATSADSTEEVVQPDGEVKTRAGETLSGLSKSTLWRCFSSVHGNRERFLVVLCVELLLLCSVMGNVL